MKIELSPLNEGHLEKMIAWRMSPEVNNVSYTSPQLTLEKQKKWFEKISMDESNQYFVVKYKQDDIGVAYIFDINHIHKSCTFGLYIGEQKYLMSGAGAMAEIKVLEYVFETLKMNRLHAEVMSNNLAVVDMHKKLGFKEEGVLRDYVCKEGTYYDVHVLSMLYSEWEIMRSKLEKFL